VNSGFQRLRVVAKDFDGLQIRSLSCFPLEFSKSWIYSYSLYFKSTSNATLTLLMLVCITSTLHSVKESLKCM